MFFKKILITILIIFIVITMFGFHDIKKPEHSTYVLTIGIDKAENDKILLTLQCMPPHILNTDYSISNTDDKLYNISIIASSLEEGAALSQNFISANLNFGHVRTVIFSEKLAREGLSKYLISLTDNELNDTNMNIYISKCTAKKFIENISPKLEANPALYFDIIEHAFNNSGTTEPIKLIDFLRDMYSDTAQPIASYCNVIDSTKSKKNKKNKLDENDNTLNPTYSPGDIEKETVSNTEILGLAIFKGDKMVDFLNNQDTNCHLLLENRLNYFYTTIYAPSSKENKKHIKENLNINLKDKSDKSSIKKSKNLTSVQLTQTKNSIIKVNIKKDVPEINIIAPLNYTIVNTNTYSFNFLDDAYKKELEKEICKNLLNNMNKYFEKVQIKNNTDIDSFSKYIKPNFLTIKEFEKYNWKDNYKKAKINVKFYLTSQTPGLYKQR